MGNLNSQRIAALYEQYKTVEVTFTKEIIQAMKLITQQIALKCAGDIWPCVIYSTSFQGAKVVANAKSEVIEKLQAANNAVSLRFCFMDPVEVVPITFFVAARIMSYSPYGDSKEMAAFNVEFTQRPPDDLIEIMGRLLDANMNASKRREERITLTPDALRKIKILPKDSTVSIQEVPRNCILRDVSFSGAKLIMMGIPKFLIDKEGDLRIDFDDPPESFTIRGKFIRTEIVEGRKDLIAMVMLFDDAQIPMGYKLRINDYISQVKPDVHSKEEQTGETPETPPAE